MTKICLIMNDNSYPGREILSKLNCTKIDVLCIGKQPLIDLMEEDRCGGYWKPLDQSILKQKHNFYFFDNLNSEELIKHLKKNNYSLGIQGGTGILKKNIINLFKFGIINFHPGDLPFYRGCSAPEYQYLDNKAIICTAHFINSKIDCGNIIDKKKLNVSYLSYSKFRASIYPEISFFVNDLINRLLIDKSIIENTIVQNEEEAIYRHYIGDDVILRLKKNFLSINRPN